MPVRRQRRPKPASNKHNATRGTRHSRDVAKQATPASRMLADAMKKKNMTTTQLHSELVSRGVMVSVSSVYSWLRGGTHVSHIAMWDLMDVLSISCAEFVKTIAAGAQEAEDGRRK